METTIVCWGHIVIMEKKMETTFSWDELRSGLRVGDFGVVVRGALNALLP